MEKINSLAEKIAHLRQERGWSQRRLSDEADLNESAVKDIESGKSRNPRQDTLKKLATALGCSLGDLTDESAPRPFKPTLSPVARIPEIDVRGGMGGGGVVALEINHTDEWGNQIARDDVRGEWDMPVDYVRHELRVVPSRVQIIEVRGDSMDPTLHSRDRVMIDLDDVDPGQGGVFAVWDGMSVLVKRIERIRNSDVPAVRVISDNPHHEPFDLVLDEGGGRIIGRAVWFGRRM